MTPQTRTPGEVISDQQKQNHLPAAYCKWYQVERETWQPLNAVSFRGCPLSLKGMRSTAAKNQGSKSSPPRSAPKRRMHVAKLHCVLLLPSCLLQLQAPCFTAAAGKLFQLLLTSTENTDLYSLWIRQQSRLSWGVQHNLLCSTDTHDLPWVTAFFFLSYFCVEWEQLLREEEDL